MLPILKLVIVLPVVIALVIFLLKVMQKFTVMQVSPKTSLRIIEQVKLSPESSVAIIKADEEYLLIGVSQGSISLLKEMSLEYSEKMVEIESLAMKKSLK